MSKAITVKEAILTVVISILGGILYMAWIPFYEWVSSLVPFLGKAISPMWYIAGIIAAYIIRKPGVAFVAEFAAASLEMIAGGQYGLSTAMSGIMQGLGAEVVFLAFGYKKWTLPVLMLASVGSNIGGYIVNYMFWGYAQKTIFIQVTNFASSTIGSLFVCGLLGKWLSDALARAGVLNSYAIVRATGRAKWEK